MKNKNAVYVVFSVAAIAAILFLISNSSAGDVNTVVPGQSGGTALTPFQQGTGFIGDSPFTGLSPIGPAPLLPNPSIPSPNQSDFPF